MVKRKPVVVAVVVGGVVALLASLALVSRSEGPSEAEAPPAPRAVASSGVVPSAPVAPARVAPASMLGGAQADEASASTSDGGEDHVGMLRSRYGERIADPHTQVRMLEELIRYFRARNPARWEEDVLALLKAAFPERYEELAAMLRNWTDYEKWTKDNRGYLQTLSDKERRAAMWDARNRLFGKDVAERIWAGELKAQAVVQSLATIDAREGASVAQKVSLFKQSLEQTYGDQAAAYLAKHQQEAMNRFLDLSSVQKDLGAMTAQERSENLRTIRRELGLDEEALKRWDSLDQVRDQRWEAGAKYMREREALAKQYGGADLEQQLTALRTRYFGEEAETLAAEEEAGFFRFQQPRVWGRN